MAQVPALQIALAWAAPGQTRPQAPQLVGVSTAASQPLEASPSQSPNPDRHVKPPLQAPAAQWPTACAGAGQTWPQVPQLPPSASRLTSQPSPGSPLQSAKPV